MKKRKNLFIYLLALILFISASSIKAKKSPFYDGEDFQSSWEKKRQQSDELADKIKQKKDKLAANQKALFQRQKAERKSIAEESRIKKEREAQIRENRGKTLVFGVLLVAFLFGLIGFKNSVEFQQIIIPYILPMLFPLILAFILSMSGQQIILKRVLGEIVGAYLAIKLYLYYTDYVKLAQEGHSVVSYSLSAVLGLGILGAAIGHLTYEYGGKENSSQFSNERELKMQYERLKNSRRKNNSTYWDYFVYICLLLVFIFMGLSRRRQNRTKRYK